MKKNEHKDKIDNLIQKASSQHETSEYYKTLQNFMHISVRRILQDNPEYLSDSRGYETFESVVDISNWLMDSIKDNEGWTSKTDDNNNPVKLNAFKTLEEMMSEITTQKEIIKQRSEASILSLNSDEGETLLCKLDRGYYLVAVPVEVELYNEDVALSAALRDSNGKTQATITYTRPLHDRDRKIIAFEDVNSSLPSLKHVELIGKFLVDQDISLSITDNQYFHGHVLDVHGELHNLEELPDDLRAFSTLNLNNYSKIDKADLPKHIKAHNVSVTGYKNTDEIVAIDGNARFKNCDNIYISNDMNINNLVLDGCNNITFEDYVCIMNNLDIINCSNINFSNALIVGGSFHLKDDNEIKELPVLLEVYGKMMLTNTKVEKISDTFNKVQSFISDNTPLTIMPKKMNTNLFEVTNANIQQGLEHINMPVSMTARFNDSFLHAMPKSAKITFNNCVVDNVVSDFEYEIVNLVDTKIENSGTSFNTVKLVVIDEKGAGIPQLAADVSIDLLSYHNKKGLNLDNIFPPANYQINRINMTVGYNPFTENKDDLSFPDTITNNMNLTFFYDENGVPRTRDTSIEKFKEFQNENKAKFSV